MEVSSNYAGYYNNTLSGSKKESNQAAEVKSDTSASSKDKVQEYYEKLCKKFPQLNFNISGISIRSSENRIVLNLSVECLKKMANDPEFAKKVEFNLSGVVTAHKWLYAQAKRDGVELPGGYTVEFDADGNASGTCHGMRTANAGSVNSSTKKLQGKNQSAEEKIRKKRKEQEKMEARRLEKRRLEKEFVKRMAGRRRERETYFDRIAEGDGKLGQYQSSYVVQQTIYFDTDI